MKRNSKTALCLGLSIAIGAVASITASAADAPVRTIVKKPAPGTWVDIHLGGKDNGGIGMTKQLAGKIWTGLRVDGLGSDVVKASADLYYKVPKQFLIWEPYFGGGIDYDLNTGETGSHITVGSKILWFFAEEEFKLENRGNTHRAGIRLSF